MKFYLDRDAGLIWCARCVPAEVATICTRDVGRRGERPHYLEVQSGDLMVSADYLRDLRSARTPLLRVRARCHECGEAQPPAS